MKNVYTIGTLLLTAILATSFSYTASADTGEDTGDDTEPLCLVDPDGVPYPCFPWVDCPGAPKVPGTCDAEWNCWCGEDGGEGHHFSGREVVEDIDGRPILPVPFWCYIVHGNAGVCGMSCGEADGDRRVISACKETTCNGEACLDCDGYAIKKYVAGTCHG